MEGLEVNNAGFWGGKRVFVTGHTGFKGSWLSLWLQQMGADLIGYSLPAPTRPSLYEAAGIARGMHSVTGDVRDFAHLKASLTSAKPEVVIHMAAQPLVRRSYADPIETYSTNVMGTVHLLEAIRQVEGVRAVVVVTSDKCYENNEWVWGYREIDPVGGRDPYSNSKGCTELVVSAFRSSFFQAEDFERHGTAVASARAGNVIGGGDWAADRLVPDLAKGFMDGQPARIRNARSIRPWQHVLEPLSGYLLLAQRLYQDGPAFAAAWNFGPRDEDARSVEWIADKMVEHWGDQAAWVLDGGTHVHEAHYLKLDWSKAHMELAWSPRWSLERAVQSVVFWYKAYHEDPRAARQASLADLQDFLQTSQ